jgi:hypothetical protein
MLTRVNVYTQCFYVSNISLHVIFVFVFLVSVFDMEFINK